MGCQLFGRATIDEDGDNENILFFDEKIPKDEFLCPNCHQLVPEILSLQVDNKVIDIKCNICDKISNEPQSYHKNLLQNNYLHKICSNCDRMPKDNKDIFFYCYDCKKEFCEKCKIEHQKMKEHTKIIKINEKNNKCLEHYDEEIIYFCLDCRKYICEKSDSGKHKSHDIKLLKDLENKISKYKEIIQKKNNELLNIIKFNETIMNCYEKRKKNYFYLKSMENIDKALKFEKERNSYDLKFLLNDYNNEMKISEEKIEKIFDDKNIKIKRQEENLLLNNKQINDENIKLISLIKFNNLKEINLSENEITNIDLLNNINLPFLELLNLSYNKIANIEPLGQINSKKLKYLFIQNNQIEDFQVFFDYDSNFKSLHILRLEENKIDEDSDTFKNLEQKYKDIVISSSYINKIKKKYKIIYDENVKEIAINDTEESDSILKYLFIIISHKNKNRIKKLNLKNNKIVDPSLLNKIQFNSLKELNLSENNIKNLDFLKGLKAQYLEHLNLDSNYINNLSPLKDFRNDSPKLTIHLINNNFDENDLNIIDIKEKNKSIELIYKPK